MISDVWTVMWKEIKETLAQRGNMRSGRMNLLLIVLVIGIVLPISSGPNWVKSPLFLFYWSWLSFFMVSTVVADSFAGERERHTLETLLVSRLSDQAILFGKITAAVAYGWGMMMISVVVGLVTVNIAHRGGGFLFYSPAIALGTFGLSLLLSVLAAGLGVLISLRAATVRQAQQTLSLSIFVFILLPLIFQILPLNTKEQIIQALGKVNINVLIPIILLVFLFLDGILILADMARFKRARLILD